MEQINITTIPFSTTTTDLVDRELGFYFLVSVKIEGNVKTSDKTVVRYRLYKSEWRQKTVYGTCEILIEKRIDYLKITPIFGHKRSGKCVIIYKGRHWNGEYVGSEDEQIMSTTQEVTKLGSSDDITIDRNPIKNARFRNGLDLWIYGTGITLMDSDLFGYIVELNLCDQFFYQRLFADSDKFTKLCFWAFNYPSGGVTNLEVRHQYTDGTSTTTEVAIQNNWFYYEVAMTAGKILRNIGFKDDGTGKCIIAMPTLVEAS